MTALTRPLCGLNQLMGNINHSPCLFCKIYARGNIAAGTSHFFFVRAIAPNSHDKGQLGRINARSQPLALHCRLQPPALSLMVDPVKPPPLTPALTPTRPPTLPSPRVSQPGMSAASGAEHGVPPSPSWRGFELKGSDRWTQVDFGTQEARPLCQRAISSGYLRSAVGVRAVG